MCELKQQTKKREFSIFKCLHSSSRSSERIQVFPRGEKSLNENLLTFFFRVRFFFAFNRTRVVHLLTIFKFPPIQELANILTRVEINSIVVRIYSSYKNRLSSWWKYIYKKNLNHCEDRNELDRLSWRIFALCRARLSHDLVNISHRPKTSCWTSAGIYSGANNSSRKRVYQMWNIKYFSISERGEIWNFLLIMNAKRTKQWSRAEIEQNMIFSFGFNPIHLAIN